MSKVQLVNDNVQALAAKRDEGLSAVADRPADRTLEYLDRMHVKKLDEFKCLSRVETQETTFSNKKV